MAKDRRQKTLPLSITEFRPDPRLPLCIWHRKTIKEILFKAVEPLLAIDQNLAVLRQCLVAADLLTPVVCKVASQVGP